MSRRRPSDEDDAWSPGVPSDVEHVRRIAEFFGVSVGVLGVIAGIGLALVLGTIARFAHLHRLPPEKGRSLVLRLRSWWVIALVVGAAVLLGRTATIALVLAVSLLALREYLRLVPEDVRDRCRRLVPWAIAATVLQYGWIWLGWERAALVFVPVVAFLGLTLLVVLGRRPEGFVHVVGAAQWGMMMLVFCVSHVAMLLAMPEATNPVGGTVGWFLYLVILTELNDIAQALWGRPLGRHKMIPEVSPGKSWEGLLGAAITTAVAAVLLAPVLTPLAEPPPRLAGGGLVAATADWWIAPWPVAIALGISIAGFFGDIAISALKRDAHVKDSGTLLPGQGGILDRIDSLTFTAPLFYYAVSWLQGGST